MQELVFKIVPYESEEYQYAMAWREAYFRKRYDMVFSQEELDEEKVAIAIIGYQAGEVVGISFLLPKIEEYELRGFLVKEDRQSQGIGSKMLAFCEEYTVKTNYKRISFRAIESAVSFYRRQNYLVQGEPEYWVSPPVTLIKMGKSVG